MAREYKNFKFRPDPKLVQEMINCIAWIRDHIDPEFTKELAGREAMEDWLDKMRRKHGRKSFPKVDRLPVGRPKLVKNMTTPRRKRPR